MSSRWAGASDVNCTFAGQVISGYFRFAPAFRKNWNREYDTTLLLFLCMLSLPRTTFLGHFRIDISTLRFPIILISTRGAVSATTTSYASVAYSRHGFQKVSFARHFDFCRYFRLFFIYFSLTAHEIRSSFSSSLHFIRNFLSLLAHY